VSEPKSPPHAQLRDADLRWRAGGAGVAMAAWSSGQPYRGRKVAGYSAPKTSRPQAFRNAGRGRLEDRRTPEILADPDEDAALARSRIRFRRCIPSMASVSVAGASGRTWAHLTFPTRRRCHLKSAYMAATRSLYIKVATGFHAIALAYPPVTAHGRDERKTGEVGDVARSGQLTDRRRPWHGARGARHSTDPASKQHWHSSAPAPGTPARRG